MGTADLLRRLFAYDDWANRETLAALQALASPPPRALGWLDHVLAAEVLWLSRLRGEPSPLAVWPELAFEQRARHLDELRDAWAALLDGLRPEGLAREIAYTNSQGEPWTSRVEDVLTHVVTHSAYHRGQIASALRAAGHEPPYTDLAHGARQGLFPVA